MIRSLCAATAMALLVTQSVSAQELTASAAPVVPSPAPVLPEPVLVPASAAPANAVDPGVTAAPAVNTDYRIGPEDLLDISVWRNPDLSRTVPVRPDGKVSLPLVNDIKAAGLTPTALRQELIDRLSEFIPAPEVAVIVREVHSMKIAVVGSVKTPGRYELKSTATVLEMIALAQGFTDFAARDRIVILREENGETKRIPFNYRKVAAGDVQANMAVQSGDIIVVP